MKKTKGFLVAAGVVLAMAFIFSCSSDDGGGGSGAKITKSKITGVSQKGPFVEGSTATLYELNDDFAQTGRSFRDIIADNKGSFEIRGVELISPYAMLEASGYYRNEVTGEVSKGPITLFAIADIREKDNVNVNLLTHLEYYRVLNLVEGGKSVAEAKKQAQKEILAVFGINGDFENSEDMTIFGATEGDAALLAISVLLQGNLGEGEFSQRLTDFAQSVKGSGNWGNEAAKAAMADWASTAYLARIRSNITGWGLSSEVPDFEKYVTDYWTVAYSLGGCSSANGGEVKKDNRNVYRICKNGNWAVASALEYDIYQWVCSDENEGEIKAGDVSSRDYVCKYGVWRESNYKDKYCFENKNKCTYFTDARDKQRYSYVVIGEQTWMAENLNYNAEGSNYANIDGYLYNWETASKICPSGWHLPTKEEWEVMITYIGGKETGGKKLKAKSGWDNGNGTDDYDFSALPFYKYGGGYMAGEFECFGGGGVGLWWSSTIESENKYYGSIIYQLGMCHDTNSIGWATFSAKESFPVRCLKD